MHTKALVFNTYFKLFCLYLRDRTIQIRNYAVFSDLLCEFIDFICNTIRSWPCKNYKKLKVAAFKTQSNIHTFSLK